MAFVGMEVQAVRNLATQLNAKAGEIENIARQLGSLLEGTQWVGNDATQFRSEWSGQHAPALHKVAEALKHAAQAAQRNAEQQEQASS